MSRKLMVMILSAALLAASCSGNDETASEAPVTADGGDTEAGANNDTDAGANNEDSADAVMDLTGEDTNNEDNGSGGSPEGESNASEGDSTISTETSENPVESAGLPEAEYEDAILDCVYGENEAGSCEALTNAGYDADEAYGLGNSITQVPDANLREGCLADQAILCAELNQRVETVASEGEEEPRLMCLFYSTVLGETATSLDFMHLRTILGADAPGGVLTALDTLESDPSNAEAKESATYLDGPCAAFLG